MARQKIREVLAEWRRIEPEMVEIKMIKTADKFQARNPDVVRYRERWRVKEESDKHIADLAKRMGKKRQLDAVLLASIDGTLFLIDGHHRLQAYRKAKRDSIPAHIRNSTEIEAIMASKVVNCDGVKLPLHSEQRREAAWQHLAIVSDRGRCECPIREVERLFGIDKNTVSRMSKRMPKVNLDDYTEEACDPGTGWPQWRHVRGNAIRERFEDVPEEKRLEHKIKKEAEYLAKRMDKVGADVFLKALRLLKDENLTEVADLLDRVDRTEKEVKMLCREFRINPDHYANY